MRTDMEFWDDVVIACIGATQRLPFTIEGTADRLLALRKERHAQWQDEADRRLREQQDEALIPTPDEIDLFRRRPIDAIKAYRNRTGVPLVAAKRAIENAAGIPPVP